MMLYSGKKFKEWKDSFFISALSGKILSRLTLNNGKVEEEILLKDFNERLRNVYETPSGNILLLTDGPGGKIFELHLSRINANFSFFYLLILCYAFASLFSAPISHSFHFTG
ncbi:MAG: hypothetical protein CM15mP22_6180 [Gammaproteobacteria bacterium]|nr:MAG: hypothetical protein CM15mP22_6180 [Gammaproteobacteria bacterium]